MQLELLYDSLCFCPREDLERVQAVCKSTRKVVTAAANKLALRRIHSVDVRPDKWVDHRFISVDMMEIFLNDYEPPADYEASVIYGDFDATFRRLQHGHVEHFYFDITDNLFMQFWRSEETEFTVKHIGFDKLPDVVDYGLLDSAINFLRPTTFRVDAADYDFSWSEGGDSRKLLGLFARDSFLNNIKTCELNIFLDGELPPVTFILSGVGCAVYELFCFECDAVGWTDRLIEAFLHGKCSNEKLESVCVQWDVFQPIRQPSRMPKLPDEPVKTNVPIPRSDFVTRRFTDDYEESQCDLYSFPLANQQKRLDVFKWGGKYPYWKERLTHALVFELKNA